MFLNILQVLMKHIELLRKGIGIGMECWTHRITFKTHFHSLNIFLIEVLDNLRVLQATKASPN